MVQNVKKCYKVSQASKSHNFEMILNHFNRKLSSPCFGRDRYGPFSPKMTFFLDRTGLNNSSSVQNLQNTLLKALNLNIMIEHQQKNIETDPKLRFLDFLTRLQGMFNCILIGSFVFNIPC